MKELSVEEKAKLYDKAIAHARLLLKTIGNATLGNLVLKNEFKNMFPVLEENEDERIRKAIIEHFAGSHSSMFPHKGFTKEQILAWLEKQGELKPTLPKWKYKNDNTPLLRDSLILNKYGCVAKSPAGALVSGVWVIDYDELAKLPKEEFENQGEQKSADKVNPKFKVGDWIVYKDTVWKICNISLKAYYELLKINNEVSIRHFEDVDKTAHLWTIQDAKDGDVLVSGEQLFLFKRMYTSNSFYAHCNYHFIGYDSLSVDDCSYSIDNICPSTKKQRGLLFQKMHEAGYEFDFEKKELKKVEQKTAAWSQEDEISIKELLYLVKTNYLSSVKPHDRLISFLESLKDRVQLQDRIDIEVWVTKNKQWILKLNGKVVRGQWGDEPQCIYKQFFYLSEIGSLKE